MNIKYVVRTIPERKLDKTYSQINFELFIDKKHNAWESFVEALEKYADYDLVLLEDDCILCRNFKQRIEDVIAKFPHNIINFYTLPQSYFTTRFSDHFNYNQCTYFPKGSTKEIIKIMKQDRDINREKYSYERSYESYEISLREALKKLKIAHLQYRPCLVQHNDHNSTLSLSREARITPYFIDYLDDLGLEYFSPDIIFKHTELIQYRNKQLNIDPLNYK